MRTKTNVSTVQTKVKKLAEKKTKKQKAPVPALMPKTATVIGLRNGYDRLRDFSVSFSSEFKNKDRYYIGTFEDPIGKFYDTFRYARQVVVDKLTSVSAGDYVALRVAGEFPNDGSCEGKFYLKEFAGMDAKGYYYFYNDDSKDRKLVKYHYLDIDFMHRIAYSFNCNMI